MSIASPPPADVVVPGSSLFVFWPGDQPPMVEEIRYALAEFGAAVVLDDEDPEGTLWSFRFEVAHKPATHLVWCEPVDRAYMKLLEGSPSVPAETARRAKACKWMVGIEGELALGNPLEDYQLQLTLCDAIARDWAPAVYDACSFHWWTASQLRSITASSCPPPIGHLYGIHQVAGKDRGTGEPWYWLHTHGLERAGMPELELLPIAARHFPAACELFETVAELWLEFTVPPPETPFWVGEKLKLRWRPWQDVAMNLDLHEPGGWAYRKAEYAHHGYRAVLSAADAASPRREALAPKALLDALADSSATLFKTARQTERQARRARERWGDFGLLFASSSSADWRYSVKLAFNAGTPTLSPISTDAKVRNIEGTHGLAGAHGGVAVATPPATASTRAGSRAVAASPPTGAREHLWFDVEKIRPGKILGRLVSQPTQPIGLRPGESAWHDLDQLTDWRILSAGRIYDPDTAMELLV